MANKILVNGANIQKLREEKKLTQAELGSKLGGIGSSKSARTIQRMENDSKYKCTKFMVEELAKVFEVPFEDLIINDKSTHEVSFIAIDEGAYRENLPPEEMHLWISIKATFIISRVCTKSIICIEFFEPKMNLSICGFHRKVLCPKWTPASSKFFIVTLGNFIISRLSTTTFFH